jgi:hypothetical protein
LSSSSNGPATTLRTRTPGAISVSGGVSRQTALVKMSTSMPRADDVHVQAARVTGARLVER